MLHGLRGVARRLGVERQALALRRSFLPAHVRADIRDHELLIAFMEEVLEPDSDCLDVGAHQGAVLREMIRLAPLGTHVAWEPLPDLARGLRSEFPSVEVREAALSDGSGERSFAHVTRDPGWSGFVERPSPGGGPVEKLVVHSERLDDALPAGVQPALIKIDVEGAEEQVLQGALGTISRHRPFIALEHGLGSADYYGTQPDQIHDLLVLELGYRRGGLDGDGPYDRERFVASSATGARVNFLARPNST